MTSFAVPRVLHRLAPFEALAVLAIAVAPLGATFPFAVLLFAVATASRWVRGRSWAELVVATASRADDAASRSDDAASPLRPLHALGLGVAAGTLAITVAAPLIGAFRVTTVDWWVLPALHGDTSQFALAVCVLLASAVALELALRGWIIERMLELSPGPPTRPVATAAVAEALVTPGPIVSRMGVALFGAGLGLLYVGCRRSVLTPIAARWAFVIGAALVDRFAG